MGKTKAKQDPTAELAAKLIVALAEQRRQGPHSYPLTVERLAQLTDPQASPAGVAKAIKKVKGFLDRVVVAKRWDVRSPLVLPEDREALAESPLLMEFLLRLARTPRSQAWTVAELKSKASLALKEPFQLAANQLIKENRLPQSIGWLMVKGRPRLFFLDDLNRGIMAGDKSSPPGFSGDGKTAICESASSATGADFPRAFDAAFDLLNRQEGAVNFVSLVDLRRTLAVFPKEVFDRELRQLWKAGRYSLRAAEGRFGVSPEERQAGFLQEGALLLYVSRNMP